VGSTTGHNLANASLLAVRTYRDCRALVSVASEPGNCHIAIEPFRGVPCIRASSAAACLQRLCRHRPRGRARPHDNAATATPAYATGCYLRIKGDIDVYVGAIVAAGQSPASALTNQDYGMREATVRDADDNDIYIVQPR